MKITRRRRISAKPKPTTITPSALAFALEHGVDLSEVQGTGKNDGIIQADVRKAKTDQLHPGTNKTVLLTLIEENKLDLSEVNPFGPFETFTLAQVEAMLLGGEEEE